MRVPVANMTGTEGLVRREGRAASRGPTLSPRQPQMVIAPALCLNCFRAQGLEVILHLLDQSLQIAVVVAGH